MTGVVTRNGNLETEMDMGVFWKTDLFLLCNVFSYPSLFLWEIPWTEEPGRLVHGSAESDPTERLHFHFSLSCIGEGNGNPLHCSGLENPRDGGAWWVAVYGSHRIRHNWCDLAGAALFPLF